MIALSVGPDGARVAFTDRADGDMGHHGRYVVDADADVEARRQRAVDVPWTWLRQVHGAQVVVVDAPGAGAGLVGDGAVTAQPGCGLAMLTADCAPVALLGRGGVIGAAHAGWAGVLAGVIEATVTEMRRCGSGPVEAVIGPCIRAECYEFGSSDLASLEAKLGPNVKANTAAGTPALDLAAAVSAALKNAGVTSIIDVGHCTACEPGWFSWRARRELERQAMVVWR